MNDKELCKQHSSDKKDANYQKFYEEVSRVATSGGAFKQKVKMLTSVSPIDPISRLSWLTLRTTN